MEKPNYERSKKLCFIIMPVGDKDTRNYEYFKEIYEDIQEFIKRKLNIDCYRGEVSYPCNIMEKVLGDLVKADFVIADLTDCNPNVFYELGIRHSFFKSRTILIMREDQKLPFDLSAYYIIRYPIKSNLQCLEWKEFRSKLEEVILKLEGNPDIVDNPVHQFLGKRIGIFDKNAKSMEEFNALEDKYIKLKDIVETDEIGKLETEVRILREENAMLKDKRPFWRKLLNF